MFNGSNCDRKSQLSGILTEPLNPRVYYWICDHYNIMFPALNLYSQMYDEVLIRP